MSFLKQEKNPMMKIMACFGWLLAANTLAQASELDHKLGAWDKSDWKCVESLSTTTEKESKEEVARHLETYVKSDGDAWLVAKFWADKKRAPFSKEENGAFFLYRMDSSGASEKDLMGVPYPDMFSFCKSPHKNLLAAVGFTHGQSHEMLASATPYFTKGIVALDIQRVWGLTEESVRTFEWLSQNVLGAEGFFYRTTADWYSQHHHVKGKDYGDLLRQLGGKTPGGWRPDAVMKDLAQDHVKVEIVEKGRKAKEIAAFKEEIKAKQLEKLAASFERKKRKLNRSFWNAKRKKKELQRLEGRYHQQKRAVLEG